MHQFTLNSRLLNVTREDVFAAHYGAYRAPEQVKHLNSGLPYRSNTGQISVKRAARLSGGRARAGARCSLYTFAMLSYDAATFV